MPVQVCTQHSKVIRASPTKCCCKYTHVCVAEIRVAPKGRNFIRASPVLLRAYTCVLQKSGLHQEVEMLSGLRCEHRHTQNTHTHTCVTHTHVRCGLGHLRVAPKGQGYKGSADHLLLRAHSCVLKKQINPGLHPKVDMLQGFGRPGAAVSIRMCVEEQ